MELQRVFEKLSDLTSRSVIPQGIIDEGRIFSLGVFVNEDHLHGRVTEVVESLKEHVGQPFELHPWAFVYDISTFKQDGRTSPITVVGVVWPQADGSVVVRDFIALPKGLRLMKQFLFRHTPDGTTVTLTGGDGRQEEKEDLVAGSLYPPATAMLNTRGCSIDLKRAPKIANAKRERQGKNLIPAHYDVDASEYFTALGSAKDTANCGGTHASPIPHLRRAHERVLPNGKRIWIPSASINVRNEGDIAFVERRKSYRRGEMRQVTVSVVGCPKISCRRSMAALEKPHCGVKLKDDCLQWAGSRPNGRIVPLCRDRPAKVLWQWGSLDPLGGKENETTPNSEPAVQSE